MALRLGELVTILLVIALAVLGIYTLWLKNRNSHLEEEKED